MYKQMMAISTSAGPIGESMVSPPQDQHVNLTPAYVTIHLGFELEVSWRNPGRPPVGNVVQRVRLTLAQSLCRQMVRCTRPVRED